MNRGKKLVSMVKNPTSQQKNEIVEFKDHSYNYPPELRTSTYSDKVENYVFSATTENENNSDIVFNTDGIFLNATHNIHDNQTSYLSNIDLANEHSFNLSTENPLQKPATIYSLETLNKDIFEEKLGDNSCGDHNGQNYQVDQLNTTLNTQLPTLATNPVPITDKVPNEDINILTTKKGTVRKRKHYPTSVADRKKFKKLEIRNKHKTKPPCVSCPKKCETKITENLRQAINEQYWEMTKQEKKIFLLQSVERQDVKRRRGKHIKQRNWSFLYFLKDSDGNKMNVCKTFFNTTLGYTKTNDKFILDICSGQKDKAAIIPSPKEKNHHLSSHKIDQEPIIQHINSFNPMIAHYRREHAPNRKYLPNEINASYMYQDFVNKNPNIKCSYDMYRKVMRLMNVSFTKLGHEECELCEEFTKHNLAHSKENLDIENCETCDKWSFHNEKYVAARSLYTHHSKQLAENEIRVSVDLQKVIMLPRMDNFKAAIFTKRIICFNESFVPIGSKSDIKPLAVIWNEGVAGRKQEDLTSCFYQYFIFNKRLNKHIIWLDNCAAQNKNWCLLTFLVFIVNSKEIDATEINLHFFQPGHSFMSADSFHHQVEMSMNKMGKVYDFDDFEKCVSNSNSGRVDTKVMKVNDFLEWKSECSSYKLKKQILRPMLNEIVYIKAERDSDFLLYSTNYDEYCPLQKLDFLKKSILHNGLKKPPQRENMHGIHPSKKESIIKILLPLMPESRKKFWYDLPCSDEAEDYYVYQETE